MSCDGFVLQIPTWAAQGVGIHFPASADYGSIVSQTTIETCYYVFIHRPGPAWLPDRPLMDQPLQGHFEYMTALEEDGVLALGGGFTDGSGALGVLRADSLAEAERIARSDPAVAAELVTTEVHPWFVTVGGRIDAGKQT